MKTDRRTVTTVPGLRLADLMQTYAVEVLDPADGWQTASALAQELGISERAAAMRLAKLVRDGVVERRQGRFAGRAGYPGWHYRPTQPHQT